MAIARAIVRVWICSGQGQMSQVLASGLWISGRLHFADKSSFRDGTS